MKKLNKILSLFALTVCASTAFAGTARADWFDCQPDNIIEFVGSRIHVRCTNTITLNGNAVRYIAVPSNSAHAARFLSQAQAAMLSGKKFTAFVPNVAPADTIGCLTSDCRVATAFGIKN